MTKDEVILELRNIYKKVRSLEEELYREKEHNRCLLAEIEYLRMTRFEGTERHCIDGRE